MKIAIFGRENVERVAAVLRQAGRQIEVHDNSASFIAASVTAHLLLVDFNENETSAICGHLSEHSATPVVALFDGRYDGWQLPSGLNVTGFIPVNISDWELGARLNAMMRWAIPASSHDKVHVNKKISERFREVPKSANTS